MKLIIRIKQPA